MPSKTDATRLPAPALHNRLIFLALEDARLYTSAELSALSGLGLSDSRTKNFSNLAKRKVIDFYLRKSGESEESWISRISIKLGKHVSLSRYINHKVIYKEGLGRNSEAYSGFLWKRNCKEADLIDAIRLGCMILELSDDRNWTVKQLLATYPIEKKAEKRIGFALQKGLSQLGYTNKEAAIPGAEWKRLIPERAKHLLLAWLAGEEVFVYPSADPNEVQEWLARKTEQATSAAEVESEPAGQGERVSEEASQGGHEKDLEQVQGEASGEEEGAEGLGEEEQGEQEEQKEEASNSGPQDQAEQAGESNRASAAQKGNDEQGKSQAPDKAGGNGEGQAKRKESYFQRLKNYLDQRKKIILGKIIIKNYNHRKINMYAIKLIKTHKKITVCALILFLFCLVLSVITEVRRNNSVDFDVPLVNLGEIRFRNIDLNPPD